jgi:hypothetical protein
MGLAERASCHEQLAAFEQPASAGADTLSAAAARRLHGAWNDVAACRALDLAYDAGKKRELGETMRLKKGLAGCAGRLEALRPEISTALLRALCPRPPGAVKRPLRSLPFFHI